MASACPSALADRLHIVDVAIMTLGTILLIVIVLALVGALPAWPYSRSWGYGSTGGLGLLLVILIVLLLLGKL